MFRIAPEMFFLLVLVLFVVATFAGLLLRGHYRESVERESGSLKTMESAVLALLGLLVGFTFSMAVSRYDNRKTLEIAEANDIGTVWLRTTLLSDAARAHEQVLLRQYVPARVQFLQAGRSEEEVQASLQATSRLQREMWQVAQADANARRDPESALFVGALNDAIDVTEARMAALENRIPLAAWCMLLFVGVTACAIVGTGLQGRSVVLRALLPLVLAATLAMIHDIDSPRAGLIRVKQQSMERLQTSLQPHQ